MTTLERIKSEVLTNVGHEAYHSRSGRPYVTAHLLQTYMEQGYTGYRNQIDNPAPAGNAKVFGSAFHLRIESFEKYKATYHFGGPTNPKTGKTYGRDTETFRKYEAEQGKPVVTIEEMELIEKMAGAMSEHPSVASLLAGGAHEICLRGELYGLPCQSLVDWIRKPLWCIVDFKTTQDIAQFSDQIIAYKYDIQMAFYRMLWREIRNVQSKVFLIAVDKQENPTCTVIRLSENRLYEAEQKIVHALGQLRHDIERSPNHA